jgi:hypothetical protein
MPVTSKAAYRAAIDRSMGVLPLPLYRHQRKVYLACLKAGYASGFTRAEMTYAREFLVSIWRMRRLT